ncbi:GSCFA domain-containing protein [Humidesulfovibrio mexicanus]|uniref:GSCFA domain-containing protein n=1 Tax=Humidesulfovibrio mexicanus TaxID=147047 RepID=UPI0015C694B2|nr:GSCFA domain-containing protein [Humidesulfovibrio mexicanus]
MVLHLEPSAACNLKCETCPGTAWRTGKWIIPKPERLYYPYNEYIALVDGLKEKGIRLQTVILVGLGEPLMNPDLSRMISYTKSVFPDSLLKIDTNAVYPKADAEALVASGLDIIRLGIDGSCQESYSRYRKGGDIQNAFKFMERLVAAKKAAGSGISIVWKYILFEHNNTMAEIEAASEYAQRLGVTLHFETGWSSTPYSKQDPAELNALMERYGWTYRVKARPQAKAPRPDQETTVAPPPPATPKINTVTDHTLETIVGALEKDPKSLPLLIHYARLLRRQNRGQEALGVYLECLDIAPKNRKAHQGAGLLMTRFGKLVEGERHLRMALSLEPEDVVTMKNLVLNLAEQGKEAEVRNLLARLYSLNVTGNDEMRELEKRVDKSLLAKGGLGQSVARYPRYQSMFEDLPSLVREYVLPGYEKITPFIHKNTKVVTLGSCFARSVCAALAELGVRSEWLSFSEDINTTLMNRHVMRFLLEMPDSGFGEQIVHAYNVQFERFRQLIREAGCVVYTLGVAPGVFEKDTDLPTLRRGKALLQGIRSGELSSRMSSVEENVRNFVDIVEMLQRAKPELTIVYTLSPVPLTASFGSPSAVVEDCVSKSVLRVACHEIAKLGLPNLHYWPSFEIAKWLAANTAPTFGGDGNTHHINPNIVQCIVQSFIGTLTSLGRK